MEEKDTRKLVREEILEHKIREIKGAFNSR
jgi:hypothetical protein